MLCSQRVESCKERSRDAYIQAVSHIRWYDGKAYLTPDNLVEIWRAFDYQITANYQSISSSSTLSNQYLQVLLANTLRLIGVILIRTGHYKSSLEYLQQELDIWQNPHHPIWISDHPKSLLETSLSDTSLVLSALGSSQEVLTYFHRKKEIRQRLVEHDPASLIPLYHQSLDPKCWDLIVQNRSGEALLFVQEWMDLLRSPAHTDQDALEEVWAYVLNIYSIALTSIGDFDAARAASLDSATRLRRLVTAEHEQYRFNLAVTLHNFSYSLSALTQHKQALEAVDEALSILEVRPWIFSFT